MKRIILALYLLVLTFGAFAQENISSDEKYIKDTNNILKRYVGTWTSENPDNSYKYEFFISKYADSSYIHYKLDILQMRYKITDAQGKVLISTENLPDGDKYIIFGKEEQGNFAKEYFFSYIGYQYQCGQGGNIQINFVKGYRGDLQLHFTPFDEDLKKDCKKEPIQWFPQMLILKKKKQ